MAIELTPPGLTMESTRSYAIGLSPPIMKWLLALARGKAESTESPTAARRFAKTMLNLNSCVERVRVCGRVQGKTVDTGDTSSENGESKSRLPGGEEKGKGRGEGREIWARF